ncbi:unnamed protein product [Microthlaspi erraticum]|uniref:Arabidopsis retrotransposon Orf1 C-terminal domain-containing protein n=1 Tax=Microthlaspi erraticum TaxID=1685480 RepID=A0A6D2JTM4_9BRAS|nr:unnamed protein product [Microthlaspi erraticum]
MGIKPILSHTRDGRRIRGDKSDTGNLMHFLDQLLTYKITAYSTRFQQGRKLSVGGLITLILCANGVNPDSKNATPPGWMVIKFCKTNTLIDHKEMNGKYQFIFKHPTAGASKILLPNPELTTVRGGKNIDFFPPPHTLVGHEDEMREEEPELDRAEDRVLVNEELGEPDCYYFEEYEAPRMNPSVVAAHKRIGLLQKFNKWQRKAMKKMQNSMDKMVSKSRVWRRKSLVLHLRRTRHLSPLPSLGADPFSPHQEDSQPKTLPEPHHMSQEKQEAANIREARVQELDAPTRPVDSIESKQRELNSVELMVELT